MDTNIFSFLEIKIFPHIIVDLAGAIIYCNNRFFETFHISKNSVIEHLLTEFFFHADGDTNLSFAGIQKNLIDVESFETDACIKKNSIVQPVHLTIRKLSKEGKKFLNIKIVLNTNQTMSDKKELKLLNKVQSFQGHTDQILFECVKLVFEELHGDFIIVKIKKNNELSFRSSYNLPHELDEKKSELFETSISKTIFSIKKPLILSNLFTNRSQINDPIVDMYTINSFLGVPIFNHNQEVIGILTIYDHLERNFGTKDIKIINIFTAKIADELYREKINVYMDDAEKNKADIKAKGMESKFSPIKNVASYVKKVSGVDIKHLDKNKISQIERKPVPQSEINKKINIQFHDTEQNVSQKTNQSSEAPNVKNISKFKFGQEESYIIDWENVKNLSDLSVEHITALVNLADKSHIGVGIIQNEKLVNANKNFLELKECRINKTYQDMTENNLLPISDIFKEEKKILTLNERDIFDHYLVKMVSPNGEIFTGDISASLITIDGNDAFEIVVSKRKVLSMMLGFVSGSFASIFQSPHQKEKSSDINIKNKIFKELEAKEIYNFKKLVDAIFIVAKSV